MTRTTRTAPCTAAGVWDLFDHHVTSEAEGVAKPDPRVYRLTLERMSPTAGECVFVDDTPANLLPAQALGIETVLADRPGTAHRAATLLGLPLFSPLRSNHGLGCHAWTRGWTGLLQTR
ncbi:HAD-IA family hydrolase [Streptosporangium sandarakinum]|uniref:HAD-IA family hydrolase n=1 Tax=Streptosporangium sandarakinum TaxID=1260955 RepID=UPI0036CC1C16